MFILERVRKHIEQLSGEINNLYEVDPDIYVRLGHKNTSIAGLCNTTYHRPQMYISLLIPCFIKMGRAVTTDLNILICHEYCHYLDALAHTARERHDSGNEYENDPIARKIDEHRTWRQTCELAKELGLWNKHFYNCLKKYNYTSEITY